VGLRSPYTQNDVAKQRKVRREMKYRSCLSQTRSTLTRFVAVSIVVPKNRICLRYDSIRDAILTCARKPT